MEKVKVSKKVLAIILVVMMLFSSFPLSMVLAAQKEIVECAACGGNGFVDCPACEDGQVNSPCTHCTEGFIDGQPCTYCGGDGIESTECTNCEGFGQLKCTTCDGTGQITNEYETCPNCEGHKTVEQDCSTCGGDGKLQVTCSTCGGSGTKTNSVECTNCSAGKVDCPDCEGGACSQCDAGYIDGQPCTYCGGSGNCAICGGSGQLDCATCGGDGQIEQNIECPTCSGSGKVESNCTECENGKVTVTCTRCEGEGKILTQNDDSFAFDDAAPAAIGVGETLSNQAKSTNNTTGEVTYSSSDNTVVTVDDNGEITAHKVGLATITASIATDYVYSSKEITYNITVEKGVPAITDYTVGAINYQQTLADSSFSSVTAQSGSKTVAGTAVWKDTTIAPTVNDSEKTEYTAVFTPDDTDNYESVEFQAKLKVNPIDITGVTIEGTTATYTGETFDAVAVEGTVEGDTVAYSEDNSSYSSTMPTITNVEDTKLVWVKVTRNENYNELVQNVTATINPAATEDVNFDVYSDTYDAAAHKAVNVTTALPFGADPVDHYVYNGNTYTECPEITDVGTYDITVVLTKNYGEAEVPVTAAIAQKDVTVITADKTVTYDAKSYSANDSTVTAELCGTDTLDSYEIVGEYSDVGNHSINTKDAVIKRGSKDVTANYNITYQAGQLTINQKEVTLTIKPVNATYTALPHPAEGYDYTTAADRFEVTGLVSGHTIEPVFSGEETAVGTYADRLGVSSYTIYNGETNVTGNYNVTVDNGDLAISYPSYDTQYTYVKDEMDKGIDGWYQNPVTIQAKEGYALCYENGDSAAFKETLVYEQNGITKPRFAIKELSTGYVSEVLEREEVKVDRVNPTTYDIEYSKALAYRVLELLSFGFYDAPAEVTLRAKDEHADIASITYQIGEEEAVTVPVEELTLDTDDSYYYVISAPASAAEFKGQISYSAKDNSGRDSTQADDQRRVIVDTKDPVITKTEYVDSVRNVGSKYYYDGDATVKFTVDEEYFFRNYYKELADLKAEQNVVDALKEDVVLKIEKNVNPVDETPQYETYYEGSANPAEATNLFSAAWDEDAKTISITIPKELNSAANDGDYIVTLSYTDLSDHSVSVTTETMVMDTVKPVVEISYEDDISAQRAAEGYFLNRTATITVEERNFDKETFAAIITAKTIAGEEIENNAAKSALADAMTNWVDSGDTHTLTIPYTDDALYTFALSTLQDYAKNDFTTKPENDNSIYKKDSETPDAFTCDEETPAISLSSAQSLAYRILNEITFGFFNYVEVTVSMSDGYSGLQKFEHISLKIEDSKGSSEEKDLTPENPDSASYTFTINSEYRDSIEATVWDNSGNTASTQKIQDTTAEDYSGVIVDTTDPIFTTTEYVDSVQQVDDKYYYSGDATAKFTIDEEYFFRNYYKKLADLKAEQNVVDALKEDVVLKIEKNVNPVDETPQYETYYEGSANPAEATNLFSAVWDEDAKTISITIPANQNDGDFIVTLTYTDLADHSATVTTKTMVIDTTPAEITPSYKTPVQVVKDKNGNEVDYYNEANPIELTLTVEERNFNAADFVSNIQVFDVLSAHNAAAESAFVDYLKEDANWSHSGDTHTIDIALEDYEANFTVDYNYADLAGNNTEAEPKNVTYDKKVPEVLELSVNETPVRKVLNGITFGIFNYLVPAEVTITARDAVAGIDTITYSSYDVDGAIGSVDKTTLQIKNQFVPASKESGLTPDASGVVSYTFTVEPQFRNGLTATAVDYSTNSTTVDTIKDGKDGSNTDGGIIKDTKEGSIAITVDESADYASKDTFASDFNFHVSVHDDNSGIGDIAVTLNGHALSEDAAGKAISSYYSGNNLIEDRSFDINSAQIKAFHDETALKYGVYVLEVTLTDNAGNVSSKDYTGYIDVFAPKVTDFSFETSGRAYVGDEEYENGEKAIVAGKDTDYYDYYFEQNTKVTVYVCDYEPEGFNKHTCGVSDITLEAYSNAGQTVTCKPVSGSFVRTTKDGVGYSTKTFLIEGPFKGNLYAIAKDYAENTPTNGETKGWVDPAYKSYLSAKYEGFVNPYDTVLEDMTQHKASSSISIKPNRDPVSSEKTQYTYNYTGNAQTDAKMDYKASKVPLYNKDIPVVLTVKDLYSGIKEIEWSVVGQPNQDSANNQNGVATVTNDGEVIGDSGWSASGESNLITTMQKTVTVRNDSNDIVILVELTDRAGNKTYDYYIVGVDKTAPQVKISYNNNSASESKYFKAPRTATVEVTDRNFNADLMNVIKNGSRLKGLSWSEVKLSDGNYRCTAKVAFDKDGDYTFKVNGKDRAQNTAKVAFAAGTVAGAEFTIDLTDPVVTVTYKSAATPKNGNYYSKPRTATIQVVEHNWNPQKFVFSLKMNDGSVQHPQLTWSNSGDTHTATYTADSVKGDKYTLDFACKDRANRDAIFVQNGARVRDYKPETFYVDQTNPAIKYEFNGQDTGSDKNATTNKEFASGVSISDTYYDYVNITIFGQAHNFTQTLRGSHQTSVDIDSIIEAISRDNKTKDDFYTVTVDAYDKAGNTTQIVRYFAVNRNGSIFTLGEAATKLVTKKYTNNPKDFAQLTIQERNVDPIDVTKSVLQLSIDGKLVTLKAGKDYTTSGGSVRENSGYYTVIYSLNASAFKNDALYKLLVTSHDGAGNTSKNSNEKGKVPGAEKLPILSFIHDETAPSIEINLDESKKDSYYSIAAGEYTVTFKPIDNGSGINYETVTLTIGKGDDAKVILLGDDQYKFTYNKETGEYSFVLKGNYSDVTFNYEDNAGNKFEQLVFKHITVSSNALARFFYNTPLFVGTLAGVVAVAAAIIILIARRKKKAAETEAGENVETKTK